MLANLNVECDYMDEKTKIIATTNFLFFLTFANQYKQKKWHGHIDVLMKKKKKHLFFTININLAFTYKITLIFVFNVLKIELAQRYIELVLNHQYHRTGS